MFHVLLYEMYREIFQDFCYSLRVVFSRQVVSDSFCNPKTVAHQAPLFMGFSRQEYWSGLPFPSLIF